ncbi:MAG: sigma-70 family RNA polymerase sigma factor [Alphaproteobacteria bacterium]|nr:MAG: sigma-70 family RNA polymerase sigma factor [Alphaproteobacteria bacterium]
MATKAQRRKPPASAARVKHPQDYALMQRVAANDSAAVEELSQKFKPLILNVACKRGFRNEQEDVLQEVLVKAWKTAGRYDGNQSKLTTWMFRIVDRHTIDLLKSRNTLSRSARKTCSLNGSQIVSASTAAAPVDFHLADLLNRAPIADHEREILGLYYGAGMGFSTIAAMTGYTTPGAKSVGHRALQKIKHMPEVRRNINGGRIKTRS